MLFNLTLLPWEYRPQQRQHRVQRKAQQSWEESVLASMLEELSIQTYVKVNWSINLIIIPWSWVGFKANFALKSNIYNDLHFQSYLNYSNLILILQIQNHYRLQIMARQVSLQQSQNAQKDILISSLKKELYELKDKEHEFIPLQNEVTTIESRYEMMQQQKERIQNEHKIKVQINRKSVSELRSQADTLKLQIHKASVNIEEVLRDIANIKRTCENRQHQISSLISASQEISSKNDQLIQDNRVESNKIKTLKEERNKHDKQTQKYLLNLQDSINLLKSLQKQARTLEASNSKLESILEVAEKDNSQLIEQMKNRQEVVITTHKKLDALNLEIETLREKTKKLEKECTKSEQEYKSTSQTLQIFINKNKEQAKKLKLFQNQLRVIENDLDKSILQRDALENDHQLLQAENQALNNQIHQIFIQINQYQKLNQQLQQQIHNYILIDEQARKMLDRKENMLNMVESVSRRILSTADNIVHLR